MGQARESSAQISARASGQNCEPPVQREGKDEEMREIVELVGGGGEHGVGAHGAWGTGTLPGGMRAGCRPAALIGC
ncbi:hypothetical protein CERSUDRAFT_101357 [Gelatoporia subvermispora B]|uniref:Uncharacterized protein n=1 Tax=Ceriporiopsis subvermispora (strain B) TaxID=914234 RepID=M2P5H2_CERS8|nr:hypothetical protein CERSUDRAFT_101357 [Gelatoporia subvermispora B]